MNKLILLLMGRVLNLCGVCMLIPFIYSIWEGSLFISIAFGCTILLLLPTVNILLSKGHSELGDSLNFYQGAVYLCLSWLIIPLVGALPYIFSSTLPIAPAIMESFSGFTTTGISQIADDYYDSMILWRSITQWVGGYNILLMLTTILPPITGCFGTTFAFPGHMRTGAVMLSRMNSTSLRVLRTYFIATVVVAALYLLNGIELFDSINMSLVTISTGGCYTLEGIVHINGWFLITGLVGLLASGCNVLIYWEALRDNQSIKLKKALQNTESRIFLLLVITAGVLTSINLYTNGYYDGLNSLINGFFQVMSFSATIGIMDESMAFWPEHAKFLLLLMALIGGCVGSLAGGFKLLRVIVLVKTSIGELKHTLHPELINPIVIDGTAMPIKMVARILSFFFLFVVTLIISVMVISISGLNMEQSMDFAIACLTSTGQLMLFHATMDDIANLPYLIQLYCSFLMVLGKLDIFAFLLFVYGSRRHMKKTKW